MKIECFLDTNILIYAANGRQDEPQKFRIASQLVDSANFGLSAQVLAEFYTNAVKSGRSGEALHPSEIDRWFSLLEVYPTAPLDPTLVRQGIIYARRYQITYYDAAIIAAAERLGAPVLYTEDLDHAQVYGSVKVINPFSPN